MNWLGCTYPVNATLENRIRLAVRLDSSPHLRQLYRRVCVTLTGYRVKRGRGQRRNRR